MEKLILKVPTIKCEGCVQNIQPVLTQRKGIAQYAATPEQVFRSTDEGENWKKIL